jgi:hypothetical protein
MNTETNATIYEIMRAAERHAVAAVSRGDTSATKESLAALITAALDSQARQINVLTAERDELRKRLDDATPAPGEWIEWRGGECPIADGIDHCVRLRIGAECRSSRPPRGWEWGHHGTGDDIIAYRVI